MHGEMAESAAGSSDKHPVMLGQLLTYSPAKAVFLSFLDLAVSGVETCIAKKLALGTDGEQALASSPTQFKQAIHLRCFHHMHGNLEGKSV